MELDPDVYTVAWIAPLEIEAIAALQMLDHRHDGYFPWSHGYDYIFLAGDINGHDVVLASLPGGQIYGTSSAAALASQVKTLFPNIRFGLLVGVAAGLPTAFRDIRLGDVLVGLPEAESAGIIAYDLGKETEDGFQLLRGGHMLATTESIIRAAIGRIKLESPNEMSLFLPFYENMKHKEHTSGTFSDPGQDCDELFEVDEYGKETFVHRERRPGSRRAHVWYGSIGSGEKLIKNSRKRNELRDKYNILGLEMEAAGIMNHIPVGVIRGVCDYGDGHKSKEWQPYAAAMAAAYAKAVLYQIFPKSVPINKLTASQPEMDPISTINASSSILGVLDMISRSIATLTNLQNLYQTDSLKIRLLISQLITMKAALVQINDLMVLLPCGGIAHNSQLSIDVAESLDCCDAIMSTLDQRLSTYQRNQATTQTNTQFVWSENENEIADFHSLLNTQVNALHLLLTAMQCKSVIEQSGFLRKVENRTVFKRVKDDTSSLLWLRDSESEITKKSTVVENLDRVNQTFAFDEDLFSSRAYRSAARSSMTQALKITVTKQWAYREINAATDDNFSVMTDQETRNWRRIDSDNPDGRLFSVGSMDQSLSVMSDTPSERSSFRPRNWTATTTSIQRQMKRQTQRLSIQQLSNIWTGSQPRIESARDRTMPQKTRGTPLYSRVFLAGNSQSGKSSAVKAINFLLGIDHDDVYLDKSTILDEVNEQMKKLLTASKTLPDERNLSLAQNLGQHTSHSQQEMGISNETHSIRAIWDALQKYPNLVDKKSISSFSDGAEYLFDSRDRITNSGYVPNYQDSMWIYARSTGIALSRYTNGPIEVILCDPGGAYSERKKWHPLEKATTILYFVDVGSYDQVPPSRSCSFDHVSDFDGKYEESNLADALVLFKDLCKAPKIQKANIVLFLHKIDKLERKIGIIPFDSSVINSVMEHPDVFSGDPHSVDDVKNYLCDVFLDTARKTHRNVTVRFTSLRDTEEFGRLVLSYSLPRKKE